MLWILSGCSFQISIYIFLAQKWVSSFPACSLFFKGDVVSRRRVITWMEGGREYFFKAEGSHENDKNDKRTL